MDTIMSNRAGFHGSEVGQGASDQAARRDDEGRQDYNNVGDVERIASVAAGAAILACGLTGRSLSRIVGLVVGGSLIYRGVEGHCAMYQALGINTAEKKHPNTAVPAQHGVKVQRSIRIAVPAEEIYRFWRVLKNISQVLPQIESVTETDPKHSIWVARSPVGATLEWHAEIIEDRLGEIISWRSLPDAEVDCAGSVRFQTIGGGDDTEVTVQIKYDPPGGKATAHVADFFGVGLEQQLDDGLARLKEHLEQRSNVAQSAARARNEAVSG